MFINIKLQRLCKSHNLQCITSSKDSEKLEKSLCVRDKAEDLCWMPVVFGPSGDTASLIDSVIDITKWAQEYFQKPLSVNTIRRAICRCQLKLYHAKRKPFVNMVQKRCCVLWAKAHLKWTVSKCSMARQVQIWHSCWKSQTPSPLGKRGGRPSRVSSVLRSKVKISDGMESSQVTFIYITLLTI